MVVDITETKLFKKPKEIIKKFIPKYRCNLTSKSKAFVFINIPKILRSKEVCDNRPSNFNISDIPMVVYNLNPSIRSTLFDYKQFALHLNTNEFLKDRNSIKCSCKKYDNSFINNNCGHVITGNLNIVNKERLRQLIAKGPKYREPKQICFEEARKLAMINSLSKYQMTKASIRIIFQNGNVMLCHQQMKKFVPLKMK